MTESELIKRALEDAYTFVKKQERTTEKDELLIDLFKAKILVNNLDIPVVMPRFLFRYKCIDEKFNVEIEAENLNKAMFNFATYYHEIQEIYSVVRVP